MAQLNREETVTAIWLRLEFKRGTNEHFAHPSKALKKKVTEVDTPDKIYYNSLATFHHPPPSSDAPV